MAFLWRKSLSVASVILDVRSDRLCATELPLTSSRVEKVVIFNVDTPSDTELADSLEEEINKADPYTTDIVIAGDFNAHLGTLAGSGPPHQQGFTL